MLLSDPREGACDSGRSPQPKFNSETDSPHGEAYRLQSGSPHSKGHAVPWTRCADDRGGLLGIPSDRSGIAGTGGAVEVRMTDNNVGYKP